MLITVRGARYNKPVRGRVGKTSEGLSDWIKEARRWRRLQCRSRGAPEDEERAKESFPHPFLRGDTVPYSSGFCKDGLCIKALVVA